LDFLSSCVVSARQLSQASLTFSDASTTSMVRTRIGLRQTGQLSIPSPFLLAGIVFRMPASLRRSNCSNGTLCHRPDRRRTYPVSGEFFVGAATDRRVFRVRFPRPAAIGILQARARGFVKSDMLHIHPYGPHKAKPRSALPAPGLLFLQIACPMACRCYRNQRRQHLAVSALTLSVRNSPNPSLRLAEQQPVCNPPRSIYQRSFQPLRQEGQPRSVRSA
jgi:hypothetical protein